MVDIRIMASPKRSENVEKTIHDLNLSKDAVTWDDRPNGGDAMYTARKAWLHPIPINAKHRVVLQDDIIVCDNFIEIINTIANAHPECVISLFALASPKCYLGPDTSPYHRVNTLNGCGILMPTDIIKPCMEWCEKSTNEYLKPHDDLMIAEYCKIHEITMIATFPNIVQHIGSDSLLHKNRTWDCKSIWYFQNPKANWLAANIIN